MHDAHLNALDAVAQLPPHLVPRGQLCDAQLVPHAPKYQQLPAEIPLRPAWLASEQRALSRLEAAERMAEAEVEPPGGTGATRLALTTALALTSTHGTTGRPAIAVDASVVIAGPSRARGGVASARRAGGGGASSSGVVAGSRAMVDAYVAVPESESDEEGPASPEWNGGRVVSSESEEEVMGSDEGGEGDEGGARGEEGRGRRRRRRQRRRTRRVGRSAVAEDSEEEEEESEKEESEESEESGGEGKSRRGRRAARAARAARMAGRRLGRGEDVSRPRRSTTKAPGAFVDSDGEWEEKYLGSRALVPTESGGQSGGAARAARVEPAAWLERAEARANEYVPQVICQ